MDNCANLSENDDVLLDGDENYFVSGSNHAGEIRGLAMSGSNVGVAAHELGPTGEAELKLYSGGMMKVFVDSGAFSEVEFPGGVPTVKKLITAAEWTKRLALYERLAESLRRQLYVVAPDMVAFQAETLERLRLYAPQLRAIKAHRANIIVPVQKGALSMAEFAAQAIEILGFDDVVWGVPMKKDATSLEDLEAFASWLNARGEESRIHLLGLGTRSKRYAKALETVVAASPWTTVFSDSVRITAMVGRGVTRKDGTTSGPRKLTAATDVVKAWGGCSTASEWKAAALGLVLGQEALETLQEARLAGWFDSELESAPGVPLED